MPTPTSPCWKTDGASSRQPEPPDWVYDGVTLGIQGGTEVCQQNWIPCATQACKSERYLGAVIGPHPHDLLASARDVELEVNSDNYPQLDSRIKQWKEEGVQFSYQPIRLPVIKTCAEAAKTRLSGERRHGRRLSGRVWREFYGGVVDLTNPGAYDWFAKTSSCH